MGGRVARLGHEGVAGLGEGEGGGALSGLRMMRLWRGVGPPSLNTMLRDSINFYVGLCMRRNALHCWANPRKVQAMERAESLLLACLGTWTCATQPKTRSREMSGFIPVYSSVGVVPNDFEGETL
jgi:hypothetical protein